MQPSEFSAFGEGLNERRRMKPGPNRKYVQNVGRKSKLDHASVRLTNQVTPPYRLGPLGNYFEYLFSAKSIDCAGHFLISTESLVGPDKLMIPDHDVRFLSKLSIDYYIITLLISFPLIANGITFEPVAPSGSISTRTKKILELKLYFSS